MLRPLFAMSFIPLCCCLSFVHNLTLSFNHVLSLITLLYPAMSFSCFSLYPESSFMLLSFFRFILHPDLSFLPLYHNNTQQHYTTALGYIKLPMYQLFLWRLYIMVLRGATSLPLKTIMYRAIKTTGTLIVIKFI